MEWMQVYDPLNNLWLSALVTFYQSLSFLFHWLFLKPKDIQPDF